MSGVDSAQNFRVFAELIEVADHPMPYFFEHVGRLLFVVRRLFNKSKRSIFKARKYNRSSFLWFITMPSRASMIPSRR